MHAGLRDCQAIMRPGSSRAVGCHAVATPTAIVDAQYRAGHPHRTTPGNEDRVILGHMALRTGSADPPSGGARAGVRSNPVGEIRIRAVTNTGMRSRSSSGGAKEIGQGWQRA